MPERKRFFFIDVVPKISAHHESVESCQMLRGSSSWLERIVVSTAYSLRTWEWTEQEEGLTLESSSERGSTGYEPGSQGLLKEAESSWRDKEAMVLPPGWVVGHR